VKTELTTRLKQACRWTAVIALDLAYSVLAHLSAASAVPDRLNALVAIVPLIGLAFVMAWRSSQRLLMLALCLAACAVLYGFRGWLVTHYNWVFLLQHAGMYALLFGAFGRTLFDGQTPMISRFARIVHGSLSPALIRYTRSATWAWTFYFGGIVGLSLLLFWLAPVPVWSAFANLLGIPLLVLMFVGEYAVRWYVLPAADRAGPLDAIRAYRQASSEGMGRRS
jgi:uncharacterized membrane protein